MICAARACKRILSMQLHKLYIRFIVQEETLTVQATLSAQDYFDQPIFSHKAISSLESTQDCCSKATKTRNSCETMWLKATKSYICSRSFLQLYVLLRLKTIPKVYQMPAKRKFKARGATDLANKTLITRVFLLLFPFCWKCFSFLLKMFFIYSFAFFLWYSWRKFPWV